MKSKINFKKGSRSAWSPYSLAVKSFIFSVLILTCIQSPLQAQETQETKFTKASWWFGVAGGANLNYFRGTTQELNSDFTVPAAFHNGNGLGLFLGPLIEFHRPDSRIGFMLQAGYDSRQGEWDRVQSPCNCPADLSTDLSYITVEPSLRFAPFKTGLYLYAGPRLAYNLAKSFTYEQGINPNYPEQVANPDVIGDFSNMNKTLISMQVGAGYDIPVFSQNKKSQLMLSPYISFQPYFGQDPRSVESWNITTFRVGAALKLGSGHKISVPSPANMIALPIDPLFRFSVISPGNIPAERRVRETFPLLNYVFFNPGSTEIPDRYVFIKKEQVKDFKEDQLEVFAPLKLSARSSREMVVYYNVLNILGDRMGKNPVSTITLVGSSEKGSQDGRAMAESVKQYLVDVFGISATRINIEGRDKPKLPSEQQGGTLELKLLREDDRRVSVESSSPALLMEFQSGPVAILKPVVINAVQEAPLDSYLSFNVEGGEEAFSSWALEIEDEKGKVQNFGPYTRGWVNLPGKSILGDKKEGNYQVTMVGQTKNGKTVKRDTTVHMVLWAPPINEEGMRFSIIYEFNDSRAITIYEKYLDEIVTPKIPQGGSVVIHGYTDIIGEELNNQRLSMARANDVQKIIKNSLSKASRNDVDFTVYGFGEDQSLSQFENNLPEERFYNRTVIIDIYPKK